MPLCLLTRLRFFPDSFVWSFYQYQYHSSDPPDPFGRIYQHGMCPENRERQPPGSFHQCRIFYIARFPGHICSVLFGPGPACTDTYQLVLQNLDALRSVAIRRQQLSFTYDWNPDALSRLHESQKTMLISSEHQDRLVVYTNALAKVCSIFKEHGIEKISVVRVIRPLFKLASDQSNVSKDPVRKTGHCCKPSLYSALVGGWTVL